jgi:TPR repeat protein
MRSAASCAPLAILPQTILEYCSTDQHSLCRLGKAADTPVSRQLTVVPLTTRTFALAVGVAAALLSSAVSADQFDDGVTAYEHGDYATAFQKWRPLADTDPRAAANIGVMYEGGLGVPKDTTEALRWLGPAAIFGSAIAQLHLGKLFMEQGRLETAAIWFRCAADQGQSDAQILLGLAYAEGDGVPQDYISAYSWLDLGVAKLDQSQKRSNAIDARDMVAKKMTPTQIGEAQAMARRWTQEKCDVAKAK